MAEWPCCHDPLRFSPASLRFVPPPPFSFNFPPKLDEATHPTLYFFTYLSCLGLVACLALRCVALPCVAMPCAALPCVGSLACLPLHAACSRHTRSLRAACRQRARSMLNLSAEFLETLSCHVSHAACAQPAHSMHAACAHMLKMSTEFFKPWLALHCIGMSCLGLCTPCLALACHGLGMSCLGLGIAPFKAFRESEAIGSLGWRGLALLPIQGIPRK